jgi:hypothetical protein
MNFNKETKGNEEYPVKYYEEFLKYIKSRFKGQYWHVLPSEITQFWMTKKKSVL